MKYIRTKDGKIYKVEKEYKNEIVVASSKTGNSNLSFHKSFISAQADTIEELCDEFIHIRKSENLKPMLCYQMHFNLRQIASRVVNTNDEICGAIWTDKGLIYVAKMNEKGELELL